MRIELRLSMGLRNAASDEKTIRKRRQSSSFGRQSARAHYTFSSQSLSCVPFVTERHSNHPIVWIEKNLPIQIDPSRPSPLVNSVERRTSASSAVSATSLLRVHSSIARPSRSSNRRTFRFRFLRRSDARRRHARASGRHLGAALASKRRHHLAASHTAVARARRRSGRHRHHRRARDRRRSRGLRTRPSSVVAICRRHGRQSFRHVPRPNL